MNDGLAGNNCQSLCLPPPGSVSAADAMPAAISTTETIRCEHVREAWECACQGACQVLRARSGV